MVAHPNRNRIICQAASLDMNSDAPKLKHACFAGDLDEMRRLLNSGADPNATDEHGSGTLLTGFRYSRTQGTRSHCFLCLLASLTANSQSGNAAPKSKWYWVVDRRDVSRTTLAYQKPCGDFLKSSR